MDHRAHERDDDKHHSREVVDHDPEVNLQRADPGYGPKVDPAKRRLESPLWIERELVVDNDEG